MKTTAVVLFSTVFILQVSTSLPKFASRTGAKCQSCHVNPTGKGMRNEYGSTYGRDEVTLPTYKELTDFEEFTNNLTSNFSVGFDFRNLMFFNQLDNTSTFFQMQGDLYLDLRLNKKVRIYLDKGLYSGFELMGIARVLPLDGYVKIGKFMPAYGTRVDDHNYFIRGGLRDDNPWRDSFPPGYAQGLAFGSRSEDNGIELGFAPSVFSFQVGVFDGTPGGGLTGVGTTKQKAVAVRGDATFKVSSVNLNIGGSIYNYPDPSGTITYYGAFGSISLFQTLTLNSEVDIPTQEFPTPPHHTGLIVWNELNYMVVQGIDLKVGYEFYDPDKDLKNGTFSRITLGAELFLLSGLEVRPLYRINLEELPNMSGMNPISNNEAQLMFHLFL